MISIINLLLTVIDIYSYLVIASAIMSWLVAFNVINPRNDIVRAIGNFLYQITEPALRPIRNILPNLGGVDISPVILLLLLWFISSLIREYAYSLLI
ncbi:MAG: YggT family protein [Chelatococcus sp.]|jgi:YggT family protein|uniref:YggT family protein n=1 Tax=unclassified Chelatococcus TaxID=2638111 RepID=UPI001BD16835|nr:MULTISPECIES: YggT family protein [unclassified Chelatococcus]CAH1653924.1 YggT family protein [Hyphomicrobiales bacterium]MBS7740180.1 YggT family protein [Chelatococcus sp. HY11]MBX3537062.1 YggT family protein [Chelatococcus sp.]MBX3544991.1 YggT family protein [Chelatococcus sp.]MCO5079923.1 YggT family protein [Chelatococcus sp.]